MTIKKLVRLLRKNRPQTIKEVRRLGIRARFFDEGCFRKVYRVRGLPLVLKIADTDAQYHTRAEIRVLRKILTWTRFRLLRRYMPKVYYCDPRGAVLLMRRYKRLRWSKHRSELFYMLECFTKDLFKFKSSPDIHFGNGGLDSKGQIKILDLGLFLNY
jgi:hypothetical protein